MKKSNDKYYQIQSQSQFSNPKEEKIYDIRERVFIEKDLQEAQEIIIISSAIINKTKRE